MTFNRNLGDSSTPDTWRQTSDSIRDNRIDDELVNGDAITERNEAIDAKVEKEVEARLKDLDCLERVITENADILAFTVANFEGASLLKEIKRFITNEVERETL